MIKLKKQVKEILKVLKERKKKCVASELAEELKLDYIVLMSAVNDLIEHDLGGFKEHEIHQASLNKEGLEYLEKGLPERQLLNIFLEENNKEFPLENLMEKSQLESNIFYVGLSNMKKNRWIAQSKASGENQIFLIQDTFPPTNLEKFLKKFEKNRIINIDTVSREDFKFLDILNKRKLLNKTNRTQREIYLTEKGKKIRLTNIKTLEQVSNITSEMLLSGTWKKYELKEFDVSKSGPLLKGGKIHPLIIIINEIREIFISMGFTEIRGPLIESAFYNFDALFQPQDHPARELHDTFYLDNPKTASLPQDDRVKAIKETHENGGTSGSKGWGYDWKKEIAQQTVLRTHTTATTIRRLAQYYMNNDKPPIKVFSIDRVFRNEKVDKSHLAEFTQIEGIVIDENVTLCDLRGILTEFYRKMGFDKIITRPGFFPYTEPSIEISVFYKKLGMWLEMGGSGIFRPEVTYPWGIKNPTRVLAWGLGLERLAMLRYQRSDIRDLYINPINWLRNESY